MVKGEKSLPDSRNYSNRHLLILGNSGNWSVMGSKNLGLEQLSEGKPLNDTHGNSPGEGKRNKLQFLMKKE